MTDECLVVKIITSVPSAFPGVLASCLIGKALANGQWSCEVVDLREFGIGRHRKIDDKPFSGGAGMVMYAEVVANALDYAIRGLVNKPRIVYVSARGAKFTQAIARRMAEEFRPLVILCGRFEGIDQRVLDLYGVEEFCIGDFVMSGGEIAAMAIIDACVRLLPGVLGNEGSALHDSFTISHNGSCLIEHPQYTRPRIWRGVSAPDTLLSGDHALIKAWKLRESLKATRAVRPDLLSDGSDRPD